MVDDSNGYGTPTRRDYMGDAGTVVVGGLFAGCAGSGSSSTPQAGSAETATGIETETAVDGGSYTVDI